MEILGKYMNGNTLVTLYEDGTKVMFTKDDEFDLDFPTNMDVKITNNCNNVAPCNAFCHENSKPGGKHAPLSNFKFINSLVAGTEVALGGGALTTHPKLEEILIKFKKQGVIVNITVHIQEVLKNADMLADFQNRGLIYGIGVSVTAHEFTEFEKEQLSKLKNVVFHIINGIFDIGFLGELSKSIAHPKLLILGFKDFRRGHQLYDKTKNLIEIKQDAMKNNLKEITKMFDVVSFDNLAIEQLDIKNQVSKEEWERGYQGEEGSITMYIDAVKGVFAQNSIAPLDKRYKLTNNVRNMFRKIQKERTHE